MGQKAKEAGEQATEAGKEVRRKLRREGGAAEAGKDARK
jgi:hypothetical protein